MRRRALVGEAQEQAEHDERHGDQRDRAELARRCCLSKSAADRRPPAPTTGRSSQARRPSGVAGSRRCEDHAQAVAGVHDEVAPEVGDDGDERADVQRHVEGLLDARRRCRRSRSSRTATGRAAGGPTRRSAGTRTGPARSRGRWRGGWARALAGESADAWARSAARYVRAARHHGVAGRRPDFGRRARHDARPPRTVGIAWWPTIGSRSLARKSAGPSKSGIST